MGEPASLTGADVLELLELAREAVERVTNDEGVPSDVLDNRVEVLEGQLLQLFQLVLLQASTLDAQFEVLRGR